MTEKDLQLTHDRWESIVLNRAIDVYGVNNQIDQAEQELIELLDALKHRRRPDRITNIYEELADVDIMLDQLKLIFHCEENCIEHSGAEAGAVGTADEGRAEA